MEEHTWTVVKFEEDGTVAAVPTKWVIGQNQCLWPPLTANKIALAIKNQEVSTDWPVYKISTFRNATYNDYKTARVKSKKAEDTSDLDSDLETGKRRITLKKFSTSESESEELTPPKLKKIKRFKRFSNQSMTSSTESKNFKLDATNTPLILNEKKLGTTNVALGVIVASTNHSSGVNEKKQETIDPFDVKVSENKLVTSNHYVVVNENRQETTNPNVDISEDCPVIKDEPIDDPLQNVGLNEDMSLKTCTCCHHHVKYFKEIIKNQNYIKKLLNDLLS